jgi:hypothetical protein
MRLYSKTGATQVDDPEYGTFAPGASGAFDGLPDGMYAKLFGRPDWESEDQRTLRLAGEELEKLRDPAELLKAMKEMGANQNALVQAIAQAIGLVPSTPSDMVAPETSASTAAPAETPAEAPPEEPASAPVKSTRGRSKAAAQPATPAE